MRVRRLRKPAAALEVTAFINVIVVLVPFLLSTAVFSRLSVIELSLPAKNSGVEQLKVDDLEALLTYENNTKSRAPFQTLLANRITRASAK